MAGARPRLYSRHANASSLTPNQLDPAAARTSACGITRFAANLVMPEAAVRDAEGENRFGVSDEAMAWRLYNLGLIETKPAAS